MKIKFTTSELKQIIGWDTQFELGDFYSSTLTIRDIRIKSRRSGKPPVLPVATLLHSWKQQKIHRWAWDEITEQNPELKTKFHIGVSDDEFPALLQEYMLKSFIASCEVLSILL